MILLLDIDGVLETSPPWKKPEFLDDTFYKFNENSQKNFIEIVDQIKPNIVLTTTHRINYSIIEWTEIFKLRGIHVGQISKINDAKQATDLQNRNIEIEAWFAKHQTTDFLILDDDKSLNALPDHLKQHWIQIDAMLGITDSIKNQILEKTNNHHSSQYCLVSECNTFLI